MGLKITTLARLPEKTDRAFFVYFLDYGWDDDLTRAMYENFDMLAEVAAENRGLLVAGLDRTEFANEVLSWHHVNNDPADDLLPAIMVTDVEPRLLADASGFDFGEVRQRPSSRTAYPERFVLIPLRDICNSAADVTELLQKLVTDLRSGRSLPDFEICRVKAKGPDAAANMVILQPNVGGIGVDLKEIYRWSKEKWQSLSAGGEKL
ncbi:MAG: hypothetical protein BroJett030_18540 [Alphaproteobacteria bacterium]|nr:MAG: hypothetical protein BroJett030_18540 [Alphaproteobacteria bacterium]